MRFRKNKRTVEKIEWDHVVVCDFCKTEIKKPDGFGVSEVDLAATVGDIYPDDICTTITEIDCCAKCFFEKVKPLLEFTFSVKFRERSSGDFSTSAYEKELV